MNKEDLNRLLQNLDDTQIELVASFAVRVAAACAERWTGQLTFVVNLAEGGLGDLGISRKDVVWLQKKRVVRNGGI